ncbi:hypothetical protein [Wukongibacter sp. M2B1]
MNNKVITMMIELMITFRDIEEKFKTYDDEDDCEGGSSKSLCISN